MPVRITHPARDLIPEERKAVKRVYREGKRSTLRPLLYSGIARGVFQ
jgi:hypothetical protein